MKFNEKQSKEILFEDVIGCEEIIEELKEIKHYIENQELYSKRGVMLNKGVLLTGPPGVGKTYLVKALANEIKCNFVYFSGSDFL